MMNRLAHALVAYRQVLLVLCVAITVCVYPLSQHIKHDRSVRSFFDPQHIRLNDYESVQKDFGGDTVCLAVYNDPELLTEAGLARLDQFREKLAKIPGILQATSLDQLRRPTNPLSPQTIKQWLESKPAEIQKLRDEVLACQLYVDQFVGSDGATAAVLLLADPIAMANGSFTRSLRELRELCDAQPNRARIVGSPVMINDVYDYLDQDAWILANISSLAMMVVIFMLFRSVRWMILPIVVVQISLIWVRALMASLGIDLSLMASLTTAMITVIGIGTAIHMAVRFQEEYFRSATAEIAMEKTLVEVVPAVFWTCATTAAGFGALAISRVAPVRDFGWIMGVATMFVFVACFALIPGGVLFLGRPAVPKPVPGERFLDWGLSSLGDLVVDRWFTSSFCVGILTLVALYGLKYLEVETDFTRNFRRNSTILEGYRFVEERMGGAGLIELAFEVPKDFGPSHLSKIRTCQANLRTLPGVTKVVTLADVIDFINPKSRTSSAGVSDFMLRTQLAVLKNSKQPEVQQVWNTSQNRMRMLLRVKEQQSSQDKDRLIDSIASTARESLGESAKVTGLYVLLVYLIESLLGDQLSSFLISCVLIYIMTYLAFGGLRMGTVGFLPNLLPIALVMGTMGWLGFRINVATAMMSSISMGLTVDFSIHYLSRFRQERDLGQNFWSALSVTNRSTGKAMFCANLALMLGFGVLTFSNFLPTMQFGLLISFAMFAGLVGNLVLLPILLRLAYWSDARKDRAAFLEQEMKR